MDGDNTASPPRRQWIAIKISDDTSRLLCRFFPCTRIAEDARRQNQAVSAGRSSTIGHHFALSRGSSHHAPHHGERQLPLPKQKAVTKKGIPPIRPVNHTYPFQQFGFCTIPSFIMHLDFFRRKSLHDAACPRCQIIQTTNLPKRFSSFRRSFPTIRLLQFPVVSNKTPINRETTNYPLHL